MDKFLATSSNLPSATLSFLFLSFHRSFHYSRRNSLSDYKPLINFVVSLCGRGTNCFLVASGRLQFFTENSTLMATLSHLLKGAHP